MIRKICKIEGCARDFYARGFCHYHYKKNIKRGTCSVEGCDRWLEAKGLCGYHYKKQWDGRTTICRVKGCLLKAYAHNYCHHHYIKYIDLGECSVKGCDRNAYIKGLCQAHYQRKMRGQDLNAPLRKSPIRPPDQFEETLSERRRKIERYKWQLKLAKWFP